VTVERVTEATDELVVAFARLLPQLTPGRSGPTLGELDAIASAPGTNLLVARDAEAVVGTLTLLLYRIPSGSRGWIHDVVVDESARGRGAGAALVDEALRLAEAAGVASVHLTARAHREAAHRMYRRLGFVEHPSQVFVWRPQ
jgi:ribosomal protein S18 acetylase RimI-like enzyme